MKCYTVHFRLSGYAHVQKSIRVENKYQVIDLKWLKTEIVNDNTEGPAGSAPYLIFLA